VTERLDGAFKKVLVRAIEPQILTQSISLSPAGPSAVQNLTESLPAQHSRNLVSEVRFALQQPLIIPGFPAVKPPKASWLLVIIPSTHQASSLT
jgi:hypothetical protein